MSRSPVPGDPTSLSQLGSDALRAARDLEAAAEAVDHLRDDRSGLEDRSVTNQRGDDGRGPRVSARVRRDLDGRAQVLVTSTRSATEELSRIGRLLQDQAADLAAARHALRAVQDKVAAVGLTLDGTHVSLPWGITGSADAEVSVRQDADRRRLQEEVDRLVSMTASKRRALESEVRQSTEALAAARGRLLT